MRNEYTLKELLSNKDEEIRKQAQALINIQFPVHSTWKITLEQVIK